MAIQSARPRLPDPVRAMLEERLRSDLDLPLLPDTAAQVLALCNDERCNARELAGLLQNDPSLAGHVLRVSNSAAYAPAEPIVSLHQAVSRLGIDVICEISIAVSLRGRVFEVPGHGARVHQIWAHSAAAGVYAKEVARFLRRNVEGAFLCGLLHDIGKPIVLQELVDLAGKRTSRPVPIGISEAAMDEFHGAVGARLIQRFRLPPWIAEAAQHHHDCANALQFPEEARITRLADFLAHWALGECAVEDVRAETTLLSELNLYADDLDRLFEMRQRVLGMTEAFL